MQFLRIRTDRHFSNESGSLESQYEELLKKCLALTEIECSQRKNGTLRCSAGLEWHGCHGISDTEANALAPAVGQPSKSAGCLAAKKNSKKKPSLASTITRFC